MQSQTTAFLEEQGRLELSCIVDAVDEEMEDDRDHEGYEV